MADTEALHMPDSIGELKWWEWFLLLFRRSCYIHEPEGEDWGTWIRYKTIFGKVYLLDSGFINKGE